jgi:hypothetical protein
MPSWVRRAASRGLQRNFASFDFNLPDRSPLRHAGLPKGHGGLAYVERDVPVGAVGAVEGGEQGPLVEAARSGWGWHLGRAPERTGKGKRGHLPV